MCRIGHVKLILKNQRKKRVTGNGRHRLGVGRNARESGEKLSKIASKFSAGRFGAALSFLNVVASGTYYDIK